MPKVVPFQIVLKGPKQTESEGEGEKRENNDNGDAAAVRPFENGGLSGCRIGHPSSKQHQEREQR